MSRLLDRLRDDFQDEDARYAYVDAYLNASVAAQIKQFRGRASQQEIAKKIGTKQSGISRLENANYSSWKVETLRKLARAFGLRLRISFEEFGTLIPEIENFNEGALSRRKFEDDPAFKDHVDQPKVAAANAQIDGILLQPAMLSQTMLADRSAQPMDFFKLPDQQEASPLRNVQRKGSGKVLVMPKRIKAKKPSRAKRYDRRKHRTVTPATATA